MFPSLYVGVAVESFLVANGDINDFQVLFVSTKKQIEIAEGIEVPEVSASMVKAFVILPPEHLGTAERILYRLSQKPREKPLRPKRTSLVAPHMSARGGNADMTWNPLSRSLSGAKRTWRVAPHMSAFDPKRTCLISVRAPPHRPPTALNFRFKG